MNSLIKNFTFVSFALYTISGLTSCPGLTEEPPIFWDIWIPGSYGRFRRFGFARGSKSPGPGFERSETHDTRLFFLVHACSWRCELSVVHATMPAFCNDSCLQLCWIPNHLLALVMMFSHKQWTSK